MSDQLNNSTTAITKSSFKVKGRGVIVELCHCENGLPRGTELISRTSLLKWKVQARIISMHAVQAHIKFGNEAVEFAHYKFKFPEERERSIGRIKEREMENIFEYFLTQVNHEEKPEEEEELEIKITSP